MHTYMLLSYTLAFTSSGARSAPTRDPATTARSTFKASGKHLGSLEPIAKHHRKHVDAAKAGEFASKNVLSAAMAIALEHYKKAIRIQKVVRGLFGRAIASGKARVYDMDSEDYVVWYDDCSRCYRAGIQPVVLVPPHIEQLQQWVTSGMTHS
mgnify:CR=1 FL=1